MRPQYVVIQPLLDNAFEALESQIRRLHCNGCLSLRKSPMLSKGISQETLTLVEGTAVRSVPMSILKSDRRHRCQRASNYWLHSVLSLWLRPVPVSKKLKNLLWSSPFRKSQYKLVNTSNTLVEWALAPTLTLLPSDGHLVGRTAIC